MSDDTDASGRDEEEGMLLGPKALLLRHPTGKMAQ
jgi:hypothetical protein